MIDPYPELPDDMPIADLELPPKLREALTATGLRTVGEVREAPDVKILLVQDLGESSLALLRKTLSYLSERFPTEVRARASGFQPLEIGHGHLPKLQRWMGSVVSV